MSCAAPGRALASRAALLAASMACGLATPDHPPRTSLWRMIRRLRWWARMFVKHEQPLVNLERSLKRKAWIRQWALPVVAVVCSVISLLITFMR